MAEEYQKAACKWCRDGEPLSEKRSEHYHILGGESFNCTAPTEAQHIEQLTTRVEALRQAERETAGQRDMEHSRRMEVEKELEEAQAELATANEVLRQIAQMFGVTDTRHILGDLGRVKAGIGVMRTALQEVFDYFMGPQACGDFTCNCGKTDACGTCEIRESTRAALSHEAVAGEAERQKDDPIRKALEGLVLEVSSLLEAQSIGVKRYARMWPIVVAAREALKGAKP